MLVYIKLSGLIWAKIQEINPEENFLPVVYNL
jgi:hypothetical protein